MKKLDILIMGQTYTLSCSDSEQPFVQEVARSLNLKMCSIREQGRIRSRETISVLAAIDLLVEQKQHEEAVNNAKRIAPTTVDTPASMDQLTLAGLHPTAYPLKNASYSKDLHDALLSIQERINAALK